MSDGLMDCRNQHLTINLSASRLIMRVTDMGRKSLMVLGFTNHDTLVKYLGLLMINKNTVK